RIRFEYIVFLWRVYRGIWPISKVVANVIAPFLKGHPKMYSFFLNVRNNFNFIMKLTNKYSAGQHKLKEIRKTVHTREDVIRH
ncbi:MAG: hypothetical protein QGI75_09390, partial [Phycisphaerales bacterium]|nr:hypothetical protein [Phycisphaerales bacterium]